MYADDYQESLRNRKNRVIADAARELVRLLNTAESSVSDIMAATAGLRDAVIEADGR